ncbi:MAG: hypothetical protein KC931_23505, partial [Candidatus Omnitrophica bacterium]|nr:hypothetical protein [Candidatus Omnitrophota bacterium]
MIRRLSVPIWSLVLGICLGGCDRLEFSQSETLEVPIPSEVNEPAPAPVSDQKGSPPPLMGTVEPIHKSPIAFPFAGKIHWLAREGAWVEGTVFSATGVRLATGTLVAELEIPDEGDSVRVLEAELALLESKVKHLQSEMASGVAGEIANLEKEVREKEKDLDRWRELERQGAKSDRDLEALAKEIDQNRAKLEKLRSSGTPRGEELEWLLAQKAVKRAELQRVLGKESSTLLYSPLEGRLHQESPAGTWAEAHQVVGEVVQMEWLQARAPIPLERANLYREGDRVRVLSVRTGKEASGVVSGIAPSKDLSKAFELEIAFWNRKVDPSDK